MKIGQYSSLRKLMRAARRGEIPPERQVIIDTAMMKAAKRYRRRCAECGKYWADPPSDTCPMCDAYKEHQA